MYDVQGNTPFYFISAVIKDIHQNTHLRAQAMVLRKPRTANLNKKRLRWLYEDLFPIKVWYRP